MAKENPISLQVRISSDEVVQLVEGSLGDLLRHIGRMFIETVMESEVASIVGPRSSRNSQRQGYRWGSEQGYCIIDGQKVPLRRPRVRGCDDREILLTSYEAFQGDLMQETVWRTLMHGLTTRNYKEVIAEFAEAYGIEKSTVSQHFVEASRQRLDQITKRLQRTGSGGGIANAAKPRERTGSAQPERSGQSARRHGRDADSSRASDSAEAAAEPGQHERNGEQFFGGRTDLLPRHEVAGEGPSTTLGGVSGAVRRDALEQDHRISASRTLQNYFSLSYNNLQTPWFGMVTHRASFKVEAHFHREERLSSFRPPPCHPSRPHRTGSLTTEPPQPAASRALSSKREQGTQKGKRPGKLPPASGISQDVIENRELDLSKSPKNCQDLTRFDQNLLFFGRNPPILDSPTRSLATPRPKAKGRSY